MTITPTGQACYGYHSHALATGPKRPWIDQSRKKAIHKSISTSDCRDELHQQPDQRSTISRPRRGGQENTRRRAISDELPPKRGSQPCRPAAGATAAPANCAQRRRGHRRVRQNDLRLLLFASRAVRSDGASAMQATIALIACPASEQNRAASQSTALIVSAAIRISASADQRSTSDAIRRDNTSRQRCHSTRRAMQQARANPVQPGAAPIEPASGRGV